jgi:uncharacterized protein YjiS (DUF1127 family)
MTIVDGLQRFEANLVRNLRASFEDLRRAQKQRQTARRTFNELNALTERELADMGISRGDLSRIAREAARTA